MVRCLAYIHGTDNRACTRASEADSVASVSRRDNLLISMAPTVSFSCSDRFPLAREGIVVRHGGVHALSEVAVSGPI